MTNNMKAIELNDEQLALVAGGHGGSYNQSNSANVWQNAESNSYVGAAAVVAGNNANDNYIGNSSASNYSSIWQKNVKKIYF